VVASPIRILPGDEHADEVRNVPGDCLVVVGEQGSQLPDLRGSEGAG
jgi:hypothetical protein